MTDQLNIHTHKSVGHISLNRPKAIHALTTEMCVAMADALGEWAVTAADWCGSGIAGDRCRLSSVAAATACAALAIRGHLQCCHQRSQYSPPDFPFSEGVHDGLP